MDSNEGVNCHHVLPQFPQLREVRNKEFKDPEESETCSQEALFDASMSYFVSYTSFL